MGRDDQRPPRRARDVVAYRRNRAPPRYLFRHSGWPEGSGRANRDVAAHLGITEQQVANYRFAAVKKLSEKIRAAGLPADVVHKITCENAAKFYRLVN